jgi:hypothetical protein
MANGIPSLLNRVAAATNPVALVAADAAQVLRMFTGPSWAVLNIDGSEALVPDSLVNLDYKREWMFPNYPLEPNAFESFNKVKTPASCNLRMTKGGTAADRSGFLQAVGALADSLTLLNILMPEGSQFITNVCISRFDYRRTSTNGIGLLSVDIAFEEIRVSATQSFSNTAQPSAADPVNTGSVQPQAPTSNQSAALSLFQ